MPRLIYVQQLKRFSNEYSALFPSAVSANTVRAAARYYAKIGARKCDQIHFENDRRMLNDVYGPRGAAVESCVAGRPLMLLHQLSDALRIIAQFCEHVCVAGL